MRIRLVLTVGYNGVGKTHVVHKACDLLHKAGHPYVARETGALILPAVTAALTQQSDHVPEAVRCPNNLLVAYYPYDPQPETAPNKDHLEWLQGRKEEVRQTWVIPTIRRIRQEQPGLVLELFRDTVLAHDPQNGVLFLNGCRANDLEFLELLPGEVDVRIALVNAPYSDRKTWFEQNKTDLSTWFKDLENQPGTPEHALRQWLADNSSKTVHEVQNGVGKELASARRLYEIATH